MAGPVPIQKAYAKAARAIQGLQNVVEWEPGQKRLPEMPCLTMMFIGLEQLDEETGPMQLVRWQWELHLYVSFSDAERAQEEMQAIVPELIRIVRVNTTLDGSCYVARIAEAVTVPELAPDDRWLRKNMRLIGEREES